MSHQAAQDMSHQAAQDMSHQVIQQGSAQRGCWKLLVREVVWFYREHRAGPEATRTLTDLHGNRLLDPDSISPGADLNGRFSIRLFSLLVHRAEPGDSGLYLCGSAHQDFFYGYDLDIQEAGALTLTPSPISSQGREEPPARPGAAPSLFQVFTRYGEWGRCDRCGPPGEQLRVGLCYLRSPYLHVRYRTANQSVASCGSGAVPHVFGLSQRSKRPEARPEVRVCHVTCPPQAPPTSRISSMLDSMGISSSSRPAGVPVVYLNRPADKDLTLRCPGSRPQHAVAWDRGSEPIYRAERLAPPHRASPPPRRHLDMGGHLVFRPAHLEDSGVYYCWLQGRKAAEIRLFVYAHFGRGHVTSHPDFQAALSAVLMLRACPAFLTFTNVATLAGFNLEMACRCKPAQVREVVWFYREHRAGPEATRTLTDLHGNRLLDPDSISPGADLDGRFSIRLFSLLVHRAEPGDSGLYLCGSAHQDFFYGYDLDIQEAGALTLTPSPISSQGREEPPARPGAAPSLFQVFTRYGEWGRCDRCGPPGEQLRVGLCYLRSPYLHVRYRTANQSVASCGSGAVPHVFGLSQRSKRPEARPEVRVCHVTCPPQAPPTSRISSMLDSMGISSSSRPAGVPVVYLNRPADKDLTLRCPGSRPQHAVAWDRGSEPIYRAERLALPHRASPPPRRHLDMGGHLVFRPAHLEDSGVYYCWLQGRKAAEIRLFVYAHFGRGHVTSHPDFQAALSAVLM
ncbi:hypothetical protein NHX12_013156, partial [Muraenolepis orangiensis]